MDPLSIPVAMLTIMMRRIIDSFYRAPVPKNLGSSAVSSNYSTYTYTILAAALWFFYSQFTKRGLTCPKTPLMAIEGGPASNNTESDRASKSKNTDETTQNKESCQQCMQRIDTPKRKKKRPSTCLKFVMRRCSKTVYYAKTTANGIARCSSYSDSQFFAKHFKGLTGRSLSSSSSEQNIRSSRKRRVRIIQWKFEGEPVAKKTRSGRIYGYINLLKY